MSSEDERRKQVEQKLWDEWWVNRFRRSRWKIPIIVTIIAIIVVVTSLFVVLPGTYGNNFVSVKWDIGAYLGYYAQPPYNMYVILPSGIGVSGNCNYVAPRNCYISNSYFMGVRVDSNEFEMVFLVYDRPVNDPADIESNSDHLVWGGYQTPNTLGVFTFEEPDGYSSRYAGKYDYYVMRWKLNNYTYMVPHGHMEWVTGFDCGTHNNVAWYGQDLNSNPVKPGTYYLYFIMYGIVAEPAPITVNVTDIYWCR